MILSRWGIWRRVRVTEHFAFCPNAHQEPSQHDDDDDDDVDDDDDDDVDYDDHDQSW